MSIVCYVIHGPRELDGAFWQLVREQLQRDGHRATFDVGDRTVNLDADGVGVLVNVETRESNEALSLDAWPDFAAGLTSRPHTLYLQAIGDGEHAITVWWRLATVLADLLDGWIYNEASGELTTADGGAPGSSGDDDEDAEVTLDWTLVPASSQRAFAVVLRWQRRPTLGNLDQIFDDLGESLHRGGSIGPNATPASTDLWREAVYLGAVGQLVVFERAAPKNHYVRVTFDIEEAMIVREPGCTGSLVELAQRLVERLKERLGAIAIDFEP